MNWIIIVLSKKNDNLYKTKLIFKKFRRTSDKLTHIWNKTSRKRICIHWFHWNMKKKARWICKYYASLSFIDRIGPLNYWFRFNFSFFCSMCSKHKIYLAEHRCITDIYFLISFCSMCIKHIIHRAQHLCYWCNNPRIRVARVVNIDAIVT